MRLKRPPQINARVDEGLRESMRLLAGYTDRSMNYLFALAVKEFLSRNSEALTEATAKASIVKLDKE